MCFFVPVVMAASIMSCCFSSTSNFYISQENCTDKRNNCQSSSHPCKSLNNPIDNYLTPNSTNFIIGPGNCTTMHLSCLTITIIIHNIIYLFFLSVHNLDQWIVRFLFATSDSHHRGLHVLHDHEPWVFGSVVYQNYSYSGSSTLIKLSWYIYLLLTYLLSKYT